MVFTMECFNTELATTLACNDTLVIRNRETTISGKTTEVIFTDMYGYDAVCMVRIMDNVQFNRGGKLVQELTINENIKYTAEVIGVISDSQIEVEINNVTINEYGYQGDRTFQRLIKG